MEYWTRLLGGLLTATLMLAFATKAVMAQEKAKAEKQNGVRAREDSAARKRVV